MLRSVLFDIIALLHGLTLTISTDCVMLIKNKTKFQIISIHS